MKMNVVETFNVWKAWFDEHGHTPRYHSEVYEERSLAYKMQNCIIYIRKHPGDYDYILQEYKRIQKEYNHIYSCKQDLRVTFNQWLDFVYEHEALPRAASEDETEKRLAGKIGCCIQGMRKKPNEYEGELKEYEELCALYGVKKSTAERITEWKNWVIEHERLPRRSGKNLTIEERRMAYNISRIYKMMLKNPEKYKELLAEYESIHKEYYVPVVRDNPFEVFLKWKAWVYENEFLPSDEGDSDEEVDIAKKIKYAIKLMNRTPDEFEEALAEYQEICVKFSKGRLIKKQKNRFQTYKLWIEKHGSFPKSGSKSIEDKRLFEKMHKLFKILKNNPEQFEKELTELEILRQKYSYSQNKTTLKKFNECKEWIYLYKRFPKASPDNTERSISGKLRRCLSLMRQSPEIFAAELEEYQILLNTYGQEAIDRKIFDLWKEWTLKNEVIPSSSSDDLNEQELAVKVKAIILKYKNNPEKHEDILQEYEFLCEQYSRKKATIKKNLLVFEEWENWCLKNERIPKAISDDEEEALLHNKIKNCIYVMRKDEKYYEDALRRYKNIYAMYKKKK